MTEAVPAAPAYRLEPLSPEHPVRGFSSGATANAAAIDRYLHEQAWPEHQAGLASVTVMVEAATGRIAGYFTLAPLSIPIADAVLATLGMVRPAYRSLGGYLLGRLGVASDHQRRGIGAALVARALRQAERGRSEGLGGAFLAVDAKDEALAAWYATLGFRRLDPAKRRLVMPLR